MVMLYSRGFFSFSSNFTVACKVASGDGNGTYRAAPLPDLVCTPVMVHLIRDGGVFLGSKRSSSLSGAFRWAMWAWTVMSSGSSCLHPVQYLTTWVSCETNTMFAPGLAEDTAWHIAFTVSVSVGANAVSEAFLCESVSELSESSELLSESEEEEDPDPDPDDVSLVRGRLPGLTEATIFLFL